MSEEFKHLTQSQLAERWGLKPNTLRDWRWKKRGPQFVKLGGKVVYPLDEVERYEQRLTGGEDPEG